ncbi:hypothetical protein [Bartonella sp. TS82HLJMH]
MRTWTGGDFGAYGVFWGYMASGVVCLKGGRQDAFMAMREGRVLKR